MYNKSSLNYPKCLKCFKKKEKTPDNQKGARGFALEINDLSQFDQ